MEVLDLRGETTYTTGVDRQFNVVPLHLYDERRPEPYRDAVEPREERGSLTHHNVRIRTRNGLEGLYGYVDPPAVETILGPLGRFLIGQDALAAEKLWDQMRFGIELDEGKVERMGVRAAG